MCGRSAKLYMAKTRSGFFAFRHSRCFHFQFITEPMPVTDKVTETPGAPDAIRSLSSTRTVATSAMWNLIGRLGPLLIAIVTTPQLVRDLGPSRWGVFTIALSLVGIFAIFDFGIGRALTRTVAELLTENRREEAASLSRTGVLALAALGCIGGLVMAVFSRLWVEKRLGIPHELQPEVLHALYLLCVAAPVVLISSALWGIIAAFQEFRSANLINVPVMSMYYIGPLITLHFYNSLVGVIVVLLLCRIAMVLGYWRICTRVLPELRHTRIHISMLPPVLRMGGWMTASNVTWPILTYVDRFIIASVLSAAATGYYSTPLDMVMRFSIIPVAIMGTAYPAMAASYRTDPANTQALFRRSMVMVAGALFVPCLVCVALSHWALTLWLGADFANHASGVLRWLGIGILLSSVDSVVAGLLDGIGKASVNAKFSFLEIAVYLPLLALLVRSTGIEGAAIAWALRCLVDLVARLWLAQHLYAPARSVALAILPLLAGATGTLCLAALMRGRVAGVVAIAVGSLLVFFLAWRSLTGAEREHLQQRAGKLMPLLRPS